MISAIVLTKNEEENISDCLKTLSWCDEILLIDDVSNDETVKVARKAKVKIIEHKLEDFAKQRNFALEQARGEWVLFIDADERVSNALQIEIQQKISKSKNCIFGYFIKRQDNMWGKKLRYGETANIKLLRLARKDAGKWIGKVHEEWRIKGNTETLQNSLMHFPHSTITEFLREINYYSDLRAKELYEKKVKSNLFSIIFYLKVKFITNYIFKLGFLDGIEGLLFAIMMSYHSFLVRSKLWLLQNR